MTQAEEEEEKELEGAEGWMSGLQAPPGGKTQATGLGVDKIL